MVMVPPLDYEKAVRVILEFLKEYVEEAGRRGVVVGLSGGLDSSVVCTLAVKALGSENVHGLIMPDRRVTPEEDVEDAVMLAEKLGVYHQVVELDQIYDSFSRAMRFYRDEAGIPNANLRARIRMIILYYYANLNGLLVCGTGDKSEIMLGYFTKYGDGGVDILPIGDLYKTQVRELARRLNLPRRIVKKPSSPRLLPGQTAEGEIGATYDEIDQILYLHFDRGLSLDEVEKKTGIDRRKIDAVVARVHANEHKRRLPPIARIK
ncbi:MAG: NAD+ synthase [Thaumarchaeota archaeon]|nr:NAD+ synthase [Nitrososphaerota archaeon]